MSYKIISKFIKDVSFEIPNAQSFVMLEKEIKNYSLNFDIKSTPYKDNILEVNTTLKMIPNQDVKHKILGEITGACLVSIDKDIDKSNFLISDVIEKPEIKESPSKNAVIGRYILPKIIFKKLKKQSKGKGGEIHITDSIRSLIKENTTFIGHKFKGKYLDCGTMNGYIKSSIEISKL